MLARRDMRLGGCRLAASTNRSMPPEFSCWKDIDQVKAGGKVVRLLLGRLKLYLARQSFRRRSRAGTKSASRESSALQNLVSEGDQPAVSQLSGHMDSARQLPDMLSGITRKRVLHRGSRLERTSCRPTLRIHYISAPSQIPHSNASPPSTPPCATGCTRCTRRSSSARA